MSLFSMQGQKMNGFLLVNKASDCTSHDVVAKIRRITKSKVGHLGTLDPFASGLLPIAIGKATKFADYFLAQNKSYKFAIKWGKNTDTLDCKGLITEESVKRPKIAAIKELLLKFKGDIMQVPPQFSALKIKGKPAYKYARTGKYVEISPRKIKIYDLQLLAQTTNEAIFSVYCSKGTYVRALARDICAQLGVCGHVSSLSREYIDNFKGYKYKLTSDFIFNQAGLNDITANLISLDQLIKLKYNYTINEFNYKKLANGVKIATNNLPFKDDQDIKLKLGSEFCMIANFASNYLKSKKLLTN